MLFPINNFSRQGCCSVHTPYLYLGLKSAANFVCRKIRARLGPAAHVNDVRLTSVRSKAILSPIHKNEAVLPREHTSRAAGKSVLSFWKTAICGMVLMITE